MSNPRKYRKLPVVVEAILYDGTTFCENQIVYWIESSVGLTDKILYQWDIETGEFFIVTLEGRMKVSHGDYVIKGVKGEFYPCKSDIFNSTYEEVTA